MRLGRARSARWPRPLTPRPLRIVERHWPVGYRRVLRGQGVIKAAKQLNEIDAFDPVVYLLRSPQEDVGLIAQCLLLPEAQAEFWCFAVAEWFDNDPDRANAALRSDFSTAKRRKARRSQLRRSRALVRPRWRLRSQAELRGRRGAS